MGKKRGKTRAKSSGEKPAPKQKISGEGQGNDDEKPFDFGGLPNRDLKKNLGCG